MSEHKQPKTYEVTLKATPDLVYEAFTNASALTEWLSDGATAHARPGGRLILWWNNGSYASGEYIDLQPEKAVAFNWLFRGQPAASQVHVSFQEGSEGTQLTLQETSTGAGADWLKALENLASVLESGPDLRMVRRPMLGVTISDFNAEIARQLGVPVEQGIRLDSVLEGMGAKAAGLKQDDVITSMAGKPATDWPSLANALQDQQAGDEVEVIFFRGGEKMSALMVLSARPIPDIPDSAEGLAQAVQAIYASLDEEMTQCLAGVSEEQASFKPAPGEWSAKESLAHLIHSERETHSWIGDLLGGNERRADDWGGNINERNRATIAAYPSLSELLEELKRSKIETVELVRALPPAFTRRKGSYWRLAYNLLESHLHPRLHMDQMAATVAAYRNQ